MAEPLRHRQTKEAATDMFSLQPPRHISTLPNSGAKADIAGGPAGAISGREQMQQGCWAVLLDHLVGAATSSLSGTVRPSMRAVWGLMTSSNLVDCTTGRSPGFAPFRMRPV